MSQGTITQPSPRQFRSPPPPSGPVAGPPPGTLLHDSLVHTALHNGVVRTVTKEGLYECRASGRPRIRTNQDRTFSLICEPGHGRFYVYVPNYNVYVILEAAFWNQAGGQDIRLKVRSRHNEPDPCDNRFGGYGWGIDRGGWESKRERCHNTHDQSAGGPIPFKPQVGQFMQLEYSVKDMTNGGVQQIAKLNGTQVMNRTTQRQAAPQSVFLPKSYIWVRQNIDSGVGEIRIKRLRMYTI